MFALLFFGFCVCNVFANIMDLKYRRPIDHFADPKDTLVFVQALWRHGDRAPTINFPTVKIDNKKWPLGLGQLTVTGMKQHLDLGKKLRRRFGKDGLNFISSSYSPKAVSYCVEILKPLWVYLRSTDLNRTLASAQSNMVGFFEGVAERDYPDDEDWPKGFIPIPVHVPMEYEEDHELIEKLNKITGLKVDFWSIWMVYDGWYINRINGVEMNDDFTDELFKQTEKLAFILDNADYGIGFDSCEGFDIRTELTKIRGGGLINSMNEHLKQKTACLNTPYKERSKELKKLCGWMDKLQYYAFSAHDTTIAALFGAFGFDQTNYEEPGFPHYSACVTIEQWKQPDGQYYIKAYYYPPEDIVPALVDKVADITSHIAGCNDKCTMEQFNKLAENFNITVSAEEIFDIFMKCFSWCQRNIIVGSNSHESRVQKIQNAVKEWNRQPPNQRKPMCTAKPNWLSLSTTFFKKEQCHQIPIPLYEILKIDEEKMTVKVEPNVSVYDLTAALIPRGYTLAVTLEIGDATAGGLAFGVGMTTYSHKVGLYQETVLSYELVTGNGDLITVTADNEHSDLFYCLPWSHGTLGFLVALEIRLIRIKPYIRLQYIPVHNQDEYCHKMMELSGALDKNAIVPDYLEATVYSSNDAVIMVGTFDDADTAEKQSKINHVTRWYKPWFYKHTETFLKKGDWELIPIKDYLLRHNRAIFWSMLPFGNHPVIRFLIGWLCPPKPAFLKFTTTNIIREMTFAKQVFQDIVMPLATLKEQINTAIELFDTFPLLVYPCRIYDHNRDLQGQLRKPQSKLITPGTTYAMFNDLGVYGTPGPVKRREPYNPTYAMREMERFTRSIGGYSFLYADIFMTESEFEEMFDLTLYRQVRKRYSADGAFPTLYEKVKPEIDVISIGEKYAEDSRKKKQ